MACSPNVCLKAFKGPLLMALFLVALLITPQSGSAQALAIKEWKGEYFKRREGGLFVKTIATGFQGSATANVQITLFGILQQKLFTFSNSQTSLDVYPKEIWKLASGKYRVERIDFVDSAGVRRVWTAKPESPVAILVPRVMLSNLGVWYISPQGANGLSVKFSAAPNTYRENGALKDSSVAAVVNGFTGSIQQVIGGKQVLDGAENDYSDKKTLRASTSFTRQIAMFYKADLFKHNKYRKDLMAALSAFDGHLRSCYTTALDRASSLKGDVVLQILASAKTGTIRQARKSKGSISDGAMIDCMINELQQVPMPIQENMVGELTFMFDVK